MNSIVCLGAPISTRINLGTVVSEVQSALREDRRLLITFLNPLIFSRLDVLEGPKRRLLRDFDIICCDGIGLVVAARLLFADLAPSRVSFDETSLAIPFFETCRDNGAPVVLVGGAPGVASAAAIALEGKVKGLIVGGTLDGFAEVPDALRFLSQHRRVVVVCGMGLPHQEQFLLNAVEAGWSGVGATCGGYMDQLLAGRAYYPRFVDRLNIRWLFRLYKEPRRLWRRYCIEYLPFLGRLLIAILGPRRNQAV